jgi:c-di-AMP phosphodiesterase-like protein
MQRYHAKTLRMALVDAIICIIIAIIIFIINKNWFYALLIGFVCFLYSLKSQYIFYQEEKNKEIDCNNNRHIKK